MMKTLPIKTETVDMQTGKVTKVSTTRAQIMPPADKEACQECGRRHPADQPHDATSLHYQYAFYGEHDRWPTWKDAVAHCAEPVKAAWEAALRERGAWSEPA